MNEPRARNTAGWAQDALVVLVAVLAFFLMAGRFELFERLQAATRGLEPWQLDELPLTLVALSVGLLWFGWRRVLEARRALAARTVAQQQAQALLAENRELAQALIRVQDTERRALARELHDEFGQHCTAIRADARFLARASDATAVAEGARRIDESAERLHGLVREMLDRLRPPDLDSLGLEAAVQALCERWEVQTGVGCAFVPRPGTPALPDDMAVTVYRLVQEALTNVARHAEATHVQIVFEPRHAPAGIRVCIVDDGRGLPSDGQPASRGGHGLAGMRERVAGYGGTLKLNNVDGGGLRIEVDLPLESLPA